MTTSKTTTKSKKSVRQKTASIAQVVRFVWRVGKIRPAIVTNIVRDNVVNLVVILDGDNDVMYHNVPPLVWKKQVSKGGEEEEGTWF